MNVKQKNQSWVMVFILILPMLFLSRIGFCEDIQVQMKKMSFSPEIVQSDAGDKIVWEKSKGHNVQFIAGPDGFSLPSKSKINKEFDIILDVPGVYYYWCTPHKGSGMIGIIVVGEDTTNIDAIANAKAFGKSKSKLAKLLEKL